jgi:hypothetical protein
MSLDPQTITVFLDASPSGERRARHAVALAQRWGSHVVGVQVVFAGVTLPLSMDFAVGHKAIHSVVAYAQRLDADAEASAAMLAEHFRSLCVRFNVDGEFRPIGRRKTAAEAILGSLHSDLVVVGHPQPLVFRMKCRPKAYCSPVACPCSSCQTHGTATRLATTS